jgi:hypothetical protein
MSVCEYLVTVVGSKEIWCNQVGTSCEKCGRTLCAQHDEDFDYFDGDDDCYFVDEKDRKYALCIHCELDDDDYKRLHSRARAAEPNGHEQCQ